MNILGTGVASSVWRRRAEDKLTDSTVAKQMIVFVRSQNVLTASAYFQRSQYWYRTTGKGCKQRWFGEWNAVFCVESHNQEASVAVLPSLTRLLLADHIIYHSVIYGYLFIIVFYICVSLKEGRNSVRYDWTILMSDNWTTRLSESRFRFRMCGTLLE